MSFVCYHKPNRGTPHAVNVKCVEAVCKARWEKATRESNLTVLR